MPGATLTIADILTIFIRILEHHHDKLNGCDAAQNSKSQEESIADIDLNRIDCQKYDGTQKWKRIRRCYKNLVRETPRCLYFML